jgi:hypothetical protein
MALIKNTNSYVDLDDADSFFEGRLHADAWNSADEIQRTKALITAARLLDNLSWIGVLRDDSQTLAFPRIGVYFDPLLGTSLELSADIPKRVKDAQMELAQHLLMTDVVNSSSGVSELKVDVIELKGLRADERFPSSVKRYITPLLDRSAHGRMWWRAN